MRIRIGLLVCFYALTAYGSDNVSLSLAGYIPAKCSITAVNNNLILSSTGLASTDLIIDCNSPMRVSMQSLNGGLRHQQSTQVKNYSVTFSIIGSKYRMSVSANNLKTRKFFNVDNILFKRTGKLQLKILDPLIYAGNYQDVLRIEMTPSVVSGGVW
ncbi:hypothetical protein MSP8887_01170 [Marinomonas spartinae]|uniref:Spore coat protein U domain-containing protein n=1 Tax=Marinomonas spartinae TaxID=1792290 RepID=A0A1A8T5U5_9GAMM|nr:hypothetical protein [Marinomonas spartinae]SBS27467.1 hypothetical protein MSP8886_00857 [Marinomonas spartinae]SBS29835.1 hypothetical protein MSP8887_01170 [Marinomonas spartinae]